MAGSLGNDQGRMFAFPPGEVFTPDAAGGGECGSAGSETLQVFHSPGHTPGHVVFYSTIAALAIVGEILSADPSAAPISPRATMPTSSTPSQQTPHSAR